MMSLMQSHGGFSLCKRRHDPAERHPILIESESDGDPDPEDVAWAAAEKTFADSIIAVIVREVKRRRGDHCAGVSPYKESCIRANVHSWGAAARKQGSCSGTEGTHEHAPLGLCPGRFLPSTFFLRGVVEFGHWAAEKRNNDPSQLIRNRCRADEPEVFKRWLSRKGRFLHVSCHAIESARGQRIEQ